MDGLSGAANVIAVINLSAKVGTLIFQYSVAVKDAKGDIETLQRTVFNTRATLESLLQLLNKHDKTQLPATHKLSLEECGRLFTQIKKDLEPGKSRKAMHRIGLRALKWPFTSKQVEKLVANLQKYEQTFSLALQVDQTELIYGVDQKLSIVDKKTDEVLSKIDIVKLPVATGASFDSHKDEHDARCLENTRVELLDEINKWATDFNSKPMFWLNGMAGTGKSTIARTVAQSFLNDHKLGASFFFKRGEGDRGSASRFFTTIVTELMTYIPEIRPEVKKAMDSDPAIHERSLKDQFEKLLLEPLDAISVKSFTPFIVIDALDECERDEDIRAILQLLSRTESVNLRIFVTSRPELHIRLGFKKLSDGTYENFVLHNVAKRTIEHDLRVYLEHSLGEIRQQRSLSTNWPSKDQIQALVEQAAPLFIFAATACRYISDQRDNPKRRLEIVLGCRKVTSKLDSIYLPILNQLFDDEDEEDKDMWVSEFREIVGSIVILESPLSVQSLARLLQKPQEDISIRLDSLHSVLSVPDAEDVPIRLLHLSFREFLVDKKKEGKISFWVNEKETNERITLHCLRLMCSAHGLRQNMCDLLPGSTRFRIKEERVTNILVPELQYACRYWVHHLEQSQNRIIDGGPVHSFLQEHFLHWLEAMSLIGDTHKCIHLLEKLQTMTNSSKGESASFLRDARRFVLRFRHILEEAPLQIYYSALLFAPQASVVRRRFAPQLLGETELLSMKSVDWDACRITLEGHDNYINAVCFSPDGRLVASAAMDREVRLWEATTGTCLSVLTGHTGQVKAVVFSPDSRLVASASDDKTIRVWEAAINTEPMTLSGHSGEVNGISFSPDGKLVVSGSDDETVRIWEVSSGLCSATLTGHSKRVVAVAFSPDGRFVASASKDRTIWIWETEKWEGRCLRQYEYGITAIDISPDSRYIVSGHENFPVEVVDVKTGEYRHLLQGHTGFINDVAFSPDGKLVASASDDRSARIWDADSGEFRTALEGHSFWVSAVSFSPDSQLVVTGSGDLTVRIWEAAVDIKPTILDTHNRYVDDVALSSNGKFLVSASRTAEIRLWDVLKGKCHATFKDHTNNIKMVTFSPNNQLAASASEDSTVRLWDVGAGSCCAILENHEKAVNIVLFSPDGCLVATVSGDLTIKLWDSSTWTERNTLSGHSRHINAISFSPDNQMVASGSADKSLRLWNAATGACQFVLKGHSKGVQAVTFSPNNKLVASTSEDLGVCIWSTATGACHRTLSAGDITPLMTAVAFSPDNQLIASISDTVVQVWEVCRGTSLSTIKGKFTNIRYLKFTPDCRSLQTNAGRISLSIPSKGIYPSHDKTNSPIFMQHQWIEYDQKPLIWIPKEYRPTSLAIHDDIICLGGMSGLVTFIRIAKP